MTVTVQISSSNCGGGGMKLECGQRRFEGQMSSPQFSYFLLLFVLLGGTSRGKGLGIAEHLPTGVLQLLQLRPPLIDGLHVLRHGRLDVLHLAEEAGQPGGRLVRRLRFAVVAVVGPGKSWEKVGNRNRNDPLDY